MTQASSDATDSTAAPCHSNHNPTLHGKPEATILPSRYDPSLENPAPTTKPLLNSAGTHTAVNAPVSKLAQILPHDLADMITRVSSPDACVAGLSIVIPKTHGELYGCHMILEIEAGRAPHLASRLFNVELVTNPSGRLVRTSDGLSITPNPKAVVQGCQFGYVDILGPRLAKAIKESPQYQRDFKDCRSRTTSVCMTFSLDGQKPVDITLSLGFYKGIEFWQEIFQ